MDHMRSSSNSCWDLLEFLLSGLHTIRALKMAQILCRRRTQAPVHQTGKPSCRVHRAKSHQPLKAAVFQHSKTKAAVLQQLNRALKESSPLKCSFPHTTPNFSQCESGSASGIHFANKHLLLVTTGQTLQTEIKCSLQRTSKIDHG